MIQIKLPRQLAQLTEGARELSVVADSVADALQELGRLHPLLMPQLLDKHGELRQFVSLFVDQEQVLDLAAAPELRAGSTLYIVTAVAGG